MLVQNGRVVKENSGHFSSRPAESPAHFPPHHHDSTARRLQKAYKAWYSPDNMGARLSQPRGPGGTTEASTPAKEPPPPTPKRPFPRQINSRTIVAPVAAFTMACILFVYARTSIRAAKANAQRHRDADSGGEGLSLLQEHRRRHGTQQRVDQGGSTVSQLATEARSQVFGKEAKDEGGKKRFGGSSSEEEERRRALRNARVSRKDA
ncbi:uncharacterized protein LTR77_010374 [Saxophila tyrrhenica]|uniref:Transmembrane protein n=1 Tax=Saxophila tyrrhenica TaxID=1690608 RepID=A0AAV9NVT1_9PEZI|nr:hypothetical protein LTR77_010374 [Saxophila tyrrhenica]